MLVLAFRCKAQCGYAHNVSCEGAYITNVPGHRIRVGDAGGICVTVGGADHRAHGPAAGHHRCANVGTRAQGFLEAFFDDDGADAAIYVFVRGGQWMGSVCSGALRAGTGSHQRQQPHGGTRRGSAGHDRLSAHVRGHLLPPPEEAAPPRVPGQRRGGLSGAFVVGRWPRGQRHRVPACDSASTRPVHARGCRGRCGGRAGDALAALRGGSCQRG
mmetsp:Transcript_30328/g.78362  ORF Transcript_30328/g.78362 Transcript_30328/m.78362 type:complete len:215 (+) Transcript_30328:879-1523(+)